MNVCREYGVTCDLANENGYCKVTGCIRKEYRIFTKPIVDEDLIRRSDAIKAIEELPNAYNGWSDAYDKAYIIGTLEEVPRAEQTEPQYDAEEVAKDINRRVAMGQRLETMSCQECKYWIFDTRWGWFCPLKGQDECKYKPKQTEPQTDCCIYDSQRDYEYDLALEQVDTDCPWK